MTEAISTLGIPLRWAAKEERGDEPLQTGYILEDPVVVRELPEERDASCEGRTSVTTLPIATEVGDRSSGLAGAARVPQVKTFRSYPDQRYILLKKYEGFVTARGEDSFTARLFENSSDYPVIEAEFDLEELSENDRKLAIEGAPLVWTIGYGYDGSTRKRESLIYLRRLSAWSEKDLMEGRKAAEDLTRAIQWE